jgi:hypothetical protein
VTELALPIVSYCSTLADILNQQYALEIPYRLLPQKLHASHKFCLDMTNEIEKFIIDEAYIDLKTQSINISEKPAIIENEHILDYLLRVGEKELHDKYLTKHIIHGTLIDSLYFIKEALSASSKQRLTVAFSLIRKPFVYNLVVILRTFFTSDFLEDFNNKDNFDATRLDKEDLKELIELSTSTLLTKSITKDDIYNFIFNQDIPDSLINISNKALHPSTTRNRNNLTGIQNINFIFSLPSDIEAQWVYFYSRLKVLLIYHVELCDFIIAHLLNLDDTFYPKRLKDRMEIYKNIS